MQICCKPSFDDVTRINFWFRLLVTWSSPRRRGASSHIICSKISLSSPKLLTFFRNSRWRLPPSWIFSLCEFGPFRRVDSAVFVFCTKFGPNICYSHWDRRTYASDVHLMTSRELPVSTFGHVVTSACPRCIFPWNLVQIYLSNTELLIFFQN